MVSVYLCGYQKFDLGFSLILSLLDALFVPLYPVNIFCISFNEGFGMGLPRAWQPSVSSSVTRFGATMGS